MKINTLTPSEEGIMQVIWLLDSAYMKDIMESHPEPKPHQNTVSTYLKILVEKKFLKTKKEGRIFKYSVAIPYNDYKSFLLKNFLETYFDGSAENLMNVLLEQSFLNAERLQTIIAGNNFVDNEQTAIREYLREITEPNKKKKKNKKKRKKDKKKK